ncbi:MAG: TonB family protein [Pseudomonadota bacterium]
MVSALEKKTPNCLLPGFICVSLLVHLLIIFYFKDIYESNTTSYIELSMRSFSKPVVRIIPQPRIRRKRLDIPKIPAIKPEISPLPVIKIDAVPPQQQMDHTVEKIRIPDLLDTINTKNPAVAGVPVSNSVSDTEHFQEHIQFTSAKDYFDMLKQRIHRVKKYPEAAKLRQSEGRVKVEFIVQTDGTLASARVVKSSHHKDLDNAALEAIEKASPFPSPPPFIFKKPITLQIKILFELI